MSNLTDQERIALPEEYNLADGHAYRKLTGAESAIISRLSSIFGRVDRRNIAQIESEYLRAFFQLGLQTLDHDRCKFFMCFTASMGLEVVANHLRLNKLKTSLIEPCFDNLADILKRHQVTLRVFPDRLMESTGPEFTRYLQQVDDDAIFLVTPNNPTGVQLTEHNLRLLAKFCKENNKLLILDTCFRFYLPDTLIYNQYQILIDSGVDFIVLEDTGKTWPTLEIKAPFFCVSQGLAHAISEIYLDFLLHVSPFSLSLMTDFVKLAQNDGRSQIRNVIWTNRKILYSSLRDTFLTPEEAHFASLSWLRIEREVVAMELKDVLARAGVHVLPGNQFFWSDPARGERHIRIALARDTDMFMRASLIIAEVCRRIGAESS